MIRRTGLVCLAIAVLAPRAGAAPEIETQPAWRKYVTFFLANRARGEFVDWFEPPPGAAVRGANRYDFFGNQLRAGVKLNLPHVQLLLEGEDVILSNLPTDASLPPPYGNLGPGANYFASSPGLHKDQNQHEVILRQGVLTLSDPPGVPGVALSGGRFEYSDGLETVPADAALAWVKRSRIAERLVGPFNYTMVGRSFDGLRLSYDRAELNLTAVAFRPTAGGFEISANRQIADIGIAGLAVTAKGIPGLPWLPFDARLFYFHYQDTRFENVDPPKPVRVDNRPLAVRQADDDATAIDTIGAHAITVYDIGPGKVDGLLWGAGQSGSWGRQTHSAWAFAVEAGYQLPRVWGAPWLRVGYDQSSGDDDPDDDVHGTFFQLLPTARIYAQFPFFNFMNSQDTFVQAIVKPHPRVTVRTDLHWLRLSEKRDLWYTGGGATNDHVFGFSGIPSSDRREVAYLADLAVTVKILEQLSAYAYYGHAFGQGVVRGTFPGKDANYGYVELIFRY